LGKVVSCGDYIFALQQADMEFDINAACEGQQYVIGITHRIAFSLNQQSP